MVIPEQRIAVGETCDLVYRMFRRGIGVGMRRASPLAVVVLGLSACSTWSEPPPLLQPAAPAQPEPAAGPTAQSNVECFALIDQGLTAIHRSREGATTDWRVQLQNRCAQAIPALVEFWVMDRNNTAIGFQARHVTASANAMVEAVGQIALDRPQSDAVASTITRWGVEAVPVASATPPPASAGYAAPAASTASAAPVASTAAAGAAASPAAMAAPFAAPAQPPERAMPMGSIPGDATPDARGDLPLLMTVGAMSWQGNAAMAPIEFVNATGAPMRQLDVTCEFVALGRVVGTDLERVPALQPGARVTVTALADVGGQPVDWVRCRGS
jgi:hypothetical protein